MRVITRLAPRTCSIETVRSRSHASHEETTSMASSTSIRLLAGTARQLGARNVSLRFSRSNVSAAWTGRRPPRPMTTSGARAPGGPARCSSYVTRLGGLTVRSRRVPRVRAWARCTRHARPLASKEQARPRSDKGRPSRRSGGTPAGETRRRARPLTAPSVPGRPHAAAPSAPPPRCAASFVPARRDHRSRSRRSRPPLRDLPMRIPAAGDLEKDVPSPHLRRLPRSSPNASWESPGAPSCHRDNPTVA